MPTIAGINIDVTTGTSKSITDLELLKGKLREVGASGGSAMAPTSAALKELEGNITSNNRAVAKFLTQVLGMGPLLQAAFPLIGGIAFGGMIFELGKKVNEFYQSIKNLPDKIAQGFMGLTRPLQLTNDELDATNARLENDIAKLEGKRQNNLAIALAEAKVAADKLAEALENDIDKFNKLMKDQQLSAMQQMFSGENNMVSESLRGIFGGETSMGGVVAKIREIQQREQQQLEGLKHSGTVPKVNTGLTVVGGPSQEQTAENIRHAADAQIKALLEPIQKGIQSFAQTNPDLTAGDKERLTYAAQWVALELGRIGKQELNTDLTARKNKDEIDNANAKADAPFAGKVKQLNNQLDEARQKMAVIGSGAQAQALVKGFDEAAKVITELNKKLEEHHQKLSQNQEVQIRSLSLDISLAQAEEQWKSHVDSLNRSLDDRIASQREVTAALNQGYEATRKASVDTQMMGVQGQYGQQWMNTHADEVAKLRKKFETEFDTQHNEQVQRALQGLNDQVQLETKLSQVITQGIEAVHQAEMAERAIELSRTHTADETARLLDAEEKLYQLRRLAESNKAVGNIQAETSGINKMSDAAFSGADAQRQQELLNRYNQMQREGASDAQVQAQIAKDVAEYQRQITDEAAKMVTQYQDQLVHLEKIRAALEEQKKADGDTLQLEIALRNVENERLKILVQQQLEIGTAQAGVKAFFLEIQEQAKKTSQIVYDALNSAVDKLSDQFANLLSGKKTNFKGMFQDMAHQFEQESIKSGMQKGLGALGKGIFGTDDNPLSKMAAGKPDGTSEEKALWVRFKQQGGGGGLPGMGGSGLGGLSGLPGLGGDDSGSGDDSGMGGDSGSMWGELGGAATGILGTFAKFGGFMAEGGDVTPGNIYGVGEKGFEFFAPKTSGSIIPADKLGGNQTHNHYYTVHAPGAELGAWTRINAGLKMAHQQAVRDANRASEERASRRPKR